MQEASDVLAGMEKHNRHLIERQELSEAMGRTLSDRSQHTIEIARAGDYYTARWSGFPNKVFGQSPQHAERALRFWAGVGRLRGKGFRPDEGAV
jgi:hypothetical protein